MSSCRWGMIGGNFLKKWRFRIGCTLDVYGIWTISIGKKIIYGRFPWEYFIYYIWWFGTWLLRLSIYWEE